MTSWTSNENQDRWKDRMRTSGNEWWQNSLTLTQDLSPNTTSLWRRLDFKPDQTGPEHDTDTLSLWGHLRHPVLIFFTAFLQHQGSTEALKEHASPSGLSNSYFSLYFSNQSALCVCLIFCQDNWWKKKFFGSGIWSRSIQKSKQMLLFPSSVKFLSYPADTTPRGPSRTTLFMTLIFNLPTLKF